MCRNFNSSGECVSQCPLHTFRDQYSENCYPCSSVCEMSQGCTGNSSSVGAGGCNTCRGMVLVHAVNETAQMFSWEWGKNNTCVAVDAPKGEIQSSPVDACGRKYPFAMFDTNVNDCPRDYYPAQADILFSFQQICVKCHPQCNGCYKAGPSGCEKCKNVSLNGKCVDSCDRNFEEINGECIQSFLMS